MHLKLPFLGLISVLLAVLMPAPAADSRTPFIQQFQIGRGTIEHLEWQPGGDILLVDTPDGAWLYSDTLQDAGHIPEIRQARFSPNGKFIAGVMRDNAVVLWDAATFEREKTLYTHLVDVKALAWSPDGLRLATLDVEGLIIIDTLATDTLTPMHMPQGEMIAWSTGGTYLAARGEKVEVWDVATGWSIFSKHVCDYGDILWRNDTHLLYHVDIVDCGDAAIWDVTTGQKVTDLPTAENFSLSQDGRFVAISREFETWGGYLATINRIEDTVEQPTPHQGEGLYEFASVMAWQHSDNQVAFGMSNDDGSAKIGVYSTYWMQPVNMLHVPYADVRFLAWHADDNRLAAAGDGWLMIWAMNRGVLLGQRETHGELTAQTLAWSADSQRIALADAFNQVRLWDAASGDQIATLTGPHDPVAQLEWQPGGTWLAARVGGQFGDYAIMYPRIYLWDTAHLRPGGEPEIILDAAWDLAWRPDGQVLALLNEDLLRLYDMPSRMLHYKSEIGTSNSRKVGWSADGGSVWIRYVRLHTPDQAFNVWDTTAQQTIISAGATVPVFGWSSAGNWLSANPYEEGINIYSRKQKSSLTITSRNIVSGADGEVLELDSLPAIINPTSIAFNADATAIAAADETHVGAVWSLPDGQRRFVFDKADRIVWNHSGTRFIVIAPDKTARVLDAFTGELHGKLELNFDGPYTPLLSWSPDDARIVYLNEGQLTIWQR